MTLTADQVAFLARLNKSPEGKFLVSMYTDDLRDLDAKLRNATGDDILRLQGRAKQLEEMIGRITTAGEKSNPRPLTRVSASQGFGA